MDDFDDVVMSELCQLVNFEGIELDVQIHRGPTSGWLLEVVDPSGTSHVWNEEFDTDQLAFAEFERTLCEEGVTAFLDEGELNPLVPLSDFEWRLLAQQIHGRSGWDLDFTRGVLAAACVHPGVEFMPSDWLPLLLGNEPVDSAAEAKRTVGLILRGYNHVQGLLDQDKGYVPNASDWPSLGAWCRGFVDCMKLDAVWRDDPDAVKMLAPALAVASSTTTTASTENISLARKIREEQNDAVDRMLFDLHGYFKAIRSEVMKNLAQTKSARNEPTRVGRNEPCPCGSGKKYKRCCGG